MLKALRNRKGVTLVELLAVVVILGIIAAIAVPTIGGLISRQQEKADIATLQSITAAAKTYALSESDNEFTLDDIKTYVELGTNEFGTVAAKDAAITAIGIRVNASLVTFHLITDDVYGPALTGIFVNTTEIVISGNTYTVAP